MVSWAWVGLSSFTKSSVNNRKINKAWMWGRVARARPSEAMSNCFGLFAGAVGLRANGTESSRVEALLP